MENMHSKDETLIRKVFNRLTEAWNTQNIELFASLYTHDVDYITFMGEHIHGLEASTRLHRNLWNSYFMKGATLQGEITAIKLVDENTAVMIAKGGIKLRFQKRMPANRMSVNTSVLINQNGEWKICSFQNTRVTGYGLFTRFMMWIDKKLTK